MICHSHTHPYFSAYLYFHAFHSTSLALSLLRPIHIRHGAPRTPTALLCVGPRWHRSISPPLYGRDPAAPTYITRLARQVPQAQTLHTVYFKRIFHPESTMPDELWILEVNTDGRQTWRSPEEYIDILNITQDPHVARHISNQWRRYYDIPLSTHTTINPLHPFLHYLILNIHRSPSANPSMLFRIKPIFFKHAAVVLRFVTHKGTQVLYSGRPREQHLLLLPEPGNVPFPALRPTSRQYDNKYPRLNSHPL